MVCESNVRDEVPASTVASWVLRETVDEGNRADTKAGHLLSLFGVLAAAVVAVASKAGLPPAVSIVLWISAAPMVLALAVLLLALRPNCIGAPWARYALLPSTVIARELCETSQAPLEYRADRIHQQSAATTRKYRAVRIAVHLVLLGGAGLIVAVVLLALI